MSRREQIVACLAFLLCAPPALFAQQGGVGSIVGQVRQVRSDVSDRIYVELQLRGADIASGYSDDQGKFGFYGLGSNPYHVLIQDERFQTIDQLVVLDTSISPVSIVQISLTPRETVKKDFSPDRKEGSNPHMVDSSEYRRSFPKSAVKEFDKGVKADKTDKKEDAIRYYERAVQIAPEFYPAHNNLGSDYLSKSDFVAAQKQFQEVIRLNQSDAAGYFNLGNVCMLMGLMPDAQHYLDEGMRRQPDSALGHFLLGSFEMRTGRYAQAEAALRQAIQLSPVMAQARLQLVNLLMRRGRNIDAVTELRQFVAQFPDDVFAPKAKQLLQKLETSSSTNAVAN